MSFREYLAYDREQALLSTMQVGGEESTRPKLLGPVFCTDSAYLLQVISQDTVTWIDSIVHETAAYLRFSVIKTK